MTGHTRVEIAEASFHDLEAGTDRAEPVRSGGRHEETGGSASGTCVCLGGKCACARGDAALVLGWLSTFDADDSARTLALYDRVSRSFLEWLGSRALTLGTLSTHDFARFRDQLEGAPATRANRLAIVKSLLSHAHAVGYTPGNVGRAVRGPRVDVDADGRSLSEAEVALLIGVAERALREER
ncbi:MAG TPA: hypothetical protein VG963_14885, partial [Polyangiaceae bacterium]|nr:hypothetical protein [Polyangiaceae bacterium]